MRTRSRDQHPQHKMPNDEQMPRAFAPMEKPGAGVRLRRAGRGASDPGARPPRPSGSQQAAASTQDRILGAWNDEGRLLNVYLRNGVKQTGRLAKWDLFSITLDVRGSVERIQKKAILSIAPAAPVDSQSGNRRGRGTPGDLR
jgi:RNA chaperone Hfq